MESRTMSDSSQTESILVDQLGLDQTTLTQTQTLLGKEPTYNPPFPKSPGKEENDSGKPEPTDPHASLQQDNIDLNH